MKGTTRMLEHKARAFLEARGETTDDWEGTCGELANEIVRPDDDIIYVEGCARWRFHMVPLIDGLIHDAWCEGPPLPIAEWLAKMFWGEEIELSLNGETIYTGTAHEYSSRNALRETQPLMQ